MTELERRTQETAKSQVMLMEFLDWLDRIPYPSGYSDGLPLPCDRAELALQFVKEREEFVEKRVEYPSVQRVGG